MSISPAQCNIRYRMTIRADAVTKVVLPNFFRLQNWVSLFLPEKSVLLSRSEPVHFVCLDCVKKSLSISHFPLSSPSLQFSWQNIGGCGPYLPVSKSSSPAKLRRAASLPQPPVRERNC